MCFSSREVSLKNLPINQTLNTNATPGLLPGTPPLSIEDGQVWRQAGRGMPPLSFAQEQRTEQTSFSSRAGFQAPSHINSYTAPS